MPGKKFSSIELLHFHTKKSIWIMPWMMNVNRTIPIDLNVCEIVDFMLIFLRVLKFQHRMWECICIGKKYPFGNFRKFISFNNNYLVDSLLLLWLRFSAFLPNTTWGDSFIWGISWGIRKSSEPTYALYHLFERN